ncbi:hypothetical protein [Streptomyces fuscigenes]|uniref:hypothetical protein n=1 Tax=Streptomyces fuscigenes TaxID=1528880 RepID=UPI001F241C7F|nr:hypothetical protein [Streptomyces fuscigenes]MCF3960472.1 hypothetical protein [Streptomyces fuscigenes]
MNRPARLTDLYDRYMTAAKLHRAHSESCDTCRPDAPCETGRPLWERFTRLQDAYLTELCKQQH